MRTQVLHHMHREHHRLAAAAHIDTRAALDQRTDVQARVARRADRERAEREGEGERKRDGGEREPERESSAS